MHRDLKPGNILVSNERIKLLDFGLAQVQQGPGDQTVTQLTQVGAVMGTPAYMAPEQWEGKQADARSDIYSSGCIFYELVNGKRAASRLAGPILLGPEVPPEGGRVVSKCLESDPELLYQHASEIRTDLRRLQRHTFVPQAPAPADRAARPRLGRGIIAIAVAAESGKAINL